MTGAQLVRGVRVPLHDTEYNVASDGRMYSSDEISRALTTARTDTIKYLFSAFEIIGTRQTYSDYTTQLSGRGLPPARARITLSNLLRTVAITTNPQSQPADFWKIECGVAGDGSYIHTEPPFLGDPLALNAYQTQIYARNGQIYGPACTLYYWSICTIAIGDDGTDLASGVGGLPDSFYNTIKYLACANLVKKERAESEDRYKFFMQLFTRRLGTLK